jgi:CRISPR-associated protein Cmr3
MSQSQDEILKITLTPLGPFFFGGEVVLGTSGAQDERRRSYLVHSNIFPQQTSLLGMLREQLLRQNNLLAPWNTEEEKELALELIGNTGFGVELDPDSFTATKKSNSFGFIKELSPVILEDSNGQLFQPFPLDEGKGKDDKNLKWSQKEGPMLLQNLDPKKGLELHFADEKGKTLMTSDLFMSQPQVGITVTNRRNWREDRANDDEAFFRQTFYKNANSELTKESDGGSREYSFTFWVRLNPGLGKKFRMLSDSIVTMGGERSTFDMKVEKVEYQENLEDFLFPVSYKNNTSPPKGYARLLLLNDTYLPNQIIDNFKVFPIGETVTFRFFSTTLKETKDFYLLAREKDKSSGKMKWKKKGRTQSQLFTLLKRGGVLFVPKDDLSKVKTVIENQTAFHQIGYNYTQKI